MKWMIRVSNLTLLTANVVPRWYGVAWWESHTDEGIFMPIPLNVVIGFFRRLYHGLRAGLRPSAIDRAFSEGWQRKGTYDYHEMRARVLLDLAREHRETELRLLKELRE